MRNSEGILDRNKVVDIDTLEDLKNYSAKVTPIIKSFGGKPLVRGGKFETLEGEDLPKNCNLGISKS